jgi:hypothetical protein
VGITVTKLNNPPKVSSATFNVAENSGVGTVVGTVIATDRDANQTLAYRITSGDNGGRFSISASTGLIVVAKNTLDFETVPQFDLNVEVTDNDGLNPMSSSAIVSIRLLDVNEV